MDKIYLGFSKDLLPPFGFPKDLGFRSFYLIHLRGYVNVF